MMTFLKFYDTVIETLETLAAIKMPPVIWHWDSDIPECDEGRYSSPNGPTWHWSAVWDEWKKSDNFRPLTDKEISVFSWSRDFGPGDWDLSPLPEWVKDICGQHELPRGQDPSQNWAIAAQALRSVREYCIEDWEKKGGLLQDRLKKELGDRQEFSECC
tara:strand:- start:1306 stop:1782 length:477 start_codon:yes stop_codon:yes gene_type:complete